MEIETQKPEPFLDGPLKNSLRIQPSSRVSGGLKVFELESPSDRFQILDQTDPLSTCWLVSDLKSKELIQNEFLKRQKSLPGDCVLRASELWRKLFRRLKPEYQIMPEPMATLLMAEWLSERGEWAKTPGVGKSAHLHMSLLAPLFAHVGGVEGMRVWFEAHPSAYDRWGHWFVECYFLWQKFETLQMASPAWISAHLLGQEIHFEKDLVVDLGLNMLTVETEILAQLANSSQVTLIEPSPTWAIDYEAQLGAYRFLELSRSGVNKTRVSRQGLSRNEFSNFAADPRSPSMPEESLDSGYSSSQAGESTSRIFVHKYPSNLGELKSSVSLVRKWLANGIAKEQIALIVPQIHQYESALRIICAAEGIPIEGGERIAVRTLPEVHAWLSALELAAGRMSSGKIEAAVFRTNNESLPRFHQFSKLYQNVYDANDLERSDWTRGHFSLENPEEGFLPPPFCRWAFEFWGTPSEPMVLLLQKFLTIAPPDLQLNISQWVSLLGELAVQTEAKVEAPQSGVRFVDLSTAENLRVSHAILIGLSEDNLSRIHKVGILPKDLWSIQRELGFNLPYIQDRNLEFDARWFLESQNVEIHLSYAASDWDGNPTGPSKIWLKAESDRLVSDLVETKLSWDNPTIEPPFTPPTTFTPVAQLSLSISAIEDYLRCPFIFAAKKVLKCDDTEAVDLELGPQTSGRLKHKILEKLLEREWPISPKMIDEMIEACAQEISVVHVSHRLWENQKHRLANMVEGFQKEEMAWRKRFPQTKTIGRELTFQVYFYDGKLHATEVPGAVRIRGSIDRVDEDESGNLVLLDYKSSVAQLTHWNRWLEGQSLQLAFYADVLRSGLTPLGIRPVIGAFYYDLKSLQRSKGFGLLEAEGSLFEIGKKKFGINSEQLDLLYLGVRECVGNALHRISQAQFEPLPKDVQECDRCRWSNLCRAKHLQRSF